MTGEVLAGRIVDLGSDRDGDWLLLEHLGDRQRLRIPDIKQLEYDYSGQTRLIDIN